MTEERINAIALELAEKLHARVQMILSGGTSAQETHMQGFNWIKDALRQVAKEAVEQPELPLQ